MTLIHHVRVGNGFPVVLLHGFCETHEIWNGFSDRLASGAQVSVISVDLPGFGSSPLLSGEFSIRDVALQMISLLQSLGIERCIVIGHSLGGYVALAMGSEKPEMIEGLVLFHSTAYPDSEEKKQNRDKVIAFVKQNGVQPYIDLFVPGLFYQKEIAGIKRVHQIASQTAEPALIGYLKAMRDRPDKTSFLKVYKKAFMILAGEHDSIIPVNALKEQTEWLFKPHFYMLSNSGHMGMIEEPANSLEALISFLNNCQKDSKD